MAQRIWSSRMAGPSNSVELAGWLNELSFASQLVALFFLAACVFATQAAEAEKAQEAPAAAPADSNRQKRFPFAYPLSYGLGYSAYHAPVYSAYHAPVVSAYHAPVVSAYHAPLAKPKNVLDALHYITASWQDVSAKTIQNCFKKAGFVKTNVLLTEDNAGLPHFQYEGFEELETRGINLDEYVHVDDNLFTREAESLNDIIDDCTPTRAETNESDDEEEHPSEPPPWKSDAFNFFALFFLAACVLAIQATEAESQPSPAQPAPVDANRNKRFYPYSLGLGLGYSAYHAPLAYSAYSAPLAYHAPLAYSAYHAPLLSSYSAYSPLAYHL
ncbi:hypothetical protein V9T40_012945 [Parthenolecanium corni]|uniref:Uncharacterized protein n=1 Tax=Parthenolecanium corni TaxID=536013 RepID=A0AAN9TBU5_9HEMI